MTSWLKRTRRILISVICCATVLFTACGAKPQEVTSVVDYRDLVESLDQKPMETAPEESVPADAEAIATQETEEPADDVITITISAAGDVSLGNYEGQDYSGSFRQKVEETEDEGYFFSNVYDIFSADDMTIVNLEGVLTTSEEIKEGQTYCIKGDPSYVTFLTHGAIETVSMANNHRMDFGEAGSRETVEMLNREGIIYAYDNNVGIYETKGIRIGFVSVRYWGEGMEYLMKDGIEKLEEEGVDLILASCHWGTEHISYPEEYQRSFGKKCIDWGADLVIGHHPHVLQGIEEYQGKFIIYSLANFCFGANRNPSDKDTMIFQQTFTFVDGMKQEDANIQVIPCSVSSISNWNDYRPTPATGSEAQRILERINEYSRDFGVQFDESGHLKTGE